MLFYWRKLKSYVSLFFFSGALSDKDIKKLLGYHIFIHPFKIENLKPSSYNLTASTCAFIKKDGKQQLIVRKNKIIIPPGETAIIETNESIYVSKWITGTYHSKVKLANKGIGHIGTTLDPCFFGVSAIALHNTSKRIVEIQVGDTIATLIFYCLKSRSSGIHDNMSGRLDDNIKLAIDSFYDFGDKGKKTIIINEDKDVKINKKYIKQKVLHITSQERLNNNINDKSIIVYDIENPVCNNCINCNENKNCAFKLLKNIKKEQEERNIIINEIEKYRSQPWITNKESLIKEVEKNVKYLNNNKDILQYSVITLVVGILIIMVLIFLINKSTFKQLTDTFKDIIQIVIPTVAIIIGMIFNHKKIKEK